MSLEESQGVLTNTEFYEILGNLEQSSAVLRNPKKSQEM